MSETGNRDASQELDERRINADPVDLFRRWFDEAFASGSRLPDAMTLATATKDGKPSARMVLLKQVDQDGFVFYTNYESAKARELEENPRAALVLYWSGLDRQVRIEGIVKRISPDESDEYFRTRPRESQLGAVASPQSEVIESREILERRYAELDQLYSDRPVERPSHWGGYRVAPERIEFWQNRPGRLHDRILYELQSDNAWTIKRLAP